MQQKRVKLFHEQGGRCFYCESPMWLKDGSKKRPAREYMKKYNVHHTEVRRFMCTIEHLVCKKDGGTNALSNLAAACLHCNSVRTDRGGDILPKSYKKIVMCRMKRGTWFNFNTMSIFDYDYSPSIVDRLIGCIISHKQWIKWLQRNWSGIIQPD